MQENILVWKIKLKNYYSKVKETQEIRKLKKIHGWCDDNSVNSTFPEIT